MSIFPKDLHGIAMNWQIAALDLPVPNDKNQETQREWNYYADCVHISTKIRKVGQALDQFNALLEKGGKPITLSQSDEELMEAKWEALAIMSSQLGRHINFMTEDFAQNFQKNFNSDVDHTLYCLIDFLKETNSSEIKTWEERREKMRNRFDDFKDLRSTSKKQPGAPKP